MKNLKLFVLMALSFCFTGNYAQLTLPEENIYSIDDVRIFQSHEYESVITRQNSVSIMLKDFVFPQIEDGLYMVALKLTMLHYPIDNPTTPTIVYEVNSLFDDVIKSVTEVEVIEDGNKTKKKKTKQHIELSLSNKMIGFNFILTEVSHIRIEVRLVKVKTEFQGIFEIVQPILNMAMTAKPLIGLIDNVITSISTDENKNNLLFSTEICIPANIFEHKKLKDKGIIPLVENNQEFAILLEGSTPINDESVTGIAKDIINKTSKFFCGKQILDKATATYSGFVRLFFTKDMVPVLPTEIKSNLLEVDALVNGFGGDDNRSEIRTTSKRISQYTGFSSKSQVINQQTEFSITHYLKLAEIYVKMLNEDEWELYFSRWISSIETKGVDKGVQVFGITGIYDGLVAKIYIPYSLGDDLLMSMYIWQKDLHNTLAAQNNKSYATELPQY